MFRRIVVAYDGSAGSDAALRSAIDLAKRVGAEIASISVEEHLPYYAASISEVAGAKEQIDEHFRTLTKQARDTALLAGVDLETVVRQGHEVERILEFARETRADLLVIGSHGYSRVFERVVGSTGLGLARLASCSVLIVRGEGLDGNRPVVVGVDGSPLGRLAFRTALDLAIASNVALTGVTVSETSALGAGEPESRYVRQLRAAAEEHARAAAVVFTHVTRSGHAAQVLRDQAAESHAGLIVIGATGLEHPWSAAIGGTAGSLAAEAPCSVLLVRPSQAALRARDVMARGAAAVAPDAPLATAVERLLQLNVKALPVVDGRRRVVGILTGGDLLRRGDMSLRLSMKQELDAQTLGERLRALVHSQTAIRDVMTSPVVTVEADADLSGVVRLMANRGVKRLPVVNEARELVGIVSRADVLRAIAALPEPAEPGDRPIPAAARTVGEAAITGVPVVTAESPADRVLELVIESPLRRAIVTSADGRVVGIVSDRDLLVRSAPEARSWLLRVFAGWRPKAFGRATTRRRSAWDALTAAGLMAPTLVSVRPEDSLARAVQLMMQHRVKRLVVVDADGRPKGLVDRREIVRLLAQQ